jgi:SAM-dependent methyltransferase
MLPHRNVPRLAGYEAPRTAANRAVTRDLYTYTYSGDELDALAGAVNYHRWIARRFAPHLGERIVEAGAGIGTFAAHLGEAAPAAHLTLVEPAANNYPHLAARHAADPRVRTVHGYLADAGPDGSADTVVAVNVLEHVQDDAAFLATAHRLLAPGGHLCLYVPAVPAIYGTLDEAFEHHRRYTRRGLRSRLEGAGFAVRSLAYTNLPGVAAWWLSGRVLRKRTVSPRDARLYDRWMIPWIAALERVWRPPLGQSLIAVAAKERG